MDDFDCVASYTDQIADCFVPGEDDEDVIEERFCRVSDNWNRYIDFFSDVQFECEYWECNNSNICIDYDNSSDCDCDYCMEQSNTIQCCNNCKHYNDSSGDYCTIKGTLCESSNQ